MTKKPRKPRTPRAPRAADNGQPAKVFPSRAKLKYVPFPKDLWERLKEMGKADERSVAYMLRKAAADYLERNGG